MPWKILGQDHLIARLRPALEQGRESHAYLLTGPPHAGKLTLAREIAQAVNCLRRSGAPCHECVQCQRIADGLHADVRVVDIEYSRMVEGRNTVTTITIDAIREMERTVNLNPFEGSRSVIIIDGAGAMTPEASNALLKTLEEPPPGVLFLLLAEDEEALLPTIRSRCQAMRLLPMSRRRMIDYLDAGARRYRRTRPTGSTGYRGAAWVGHCKPRPTRRFSTSGRPTWSGCGKRWARAWIRASATPTK